MSNNQPAPALSVHNIADQQHGIIAAAFQHPAAWQAQSQVVWNFQHYTQPLQLFARVFDPSGFSMVEFFPVEQFCWIDPDLGMRRPGQDLGDGTALLPIMPAPDVMIRWVVPKYRGKATGLRVLGARAIPNLAQLLEMPPIPNAQLEGVSVRIEYQLNNRAVEEDFIGLKIVNQGIPSYGAAGCLMQYNWGFGRLFALRAERGQLDAESPRCWQIVRSVKVNPQWEQLYQRVLQQLKALFDQYIQAGYANIEAARRMSQQISAQNQAWLDSQQQNREESYRREQQQRAAQASSYSANDAFGDYILGRETYDDPNSPGGSSQHYGYHQNVWTDGQNNYRYTDNALDDPNIGSDRQWTRLEKKQVGE